MLKFSQVSQDPFTKLYIILNDDDALYTSNLWWISQIFLNKRMEFFLYYINHPKKTPCCCPNKLHYYTLYNIHNKCTHKIVCVKIHIYTKEKWKWINRNRKYITILLSMRFEIYYIQKVYILERYIVFYNNILNAFNKRKKSYIF